ncbi:MAG: murein biosynthesis integral membrane protein MurJ [Candidatus Wildermuthbacteria bacterium]|nr:murein biosynthesis integral membrane protein MurJ [Candidatus Wildermuthbacteria bacterium]
MIARILNLQSKTVAFGAFLLAGSALFSSVLGLFRDRLLASQFGAGPDLDMYFAAFRIPDFLYGILIMGGLSAAFLPVFSEYFQKDEKAAWKFAGQMLNCIVLALGIIAVLLFFAIPFLIPLVVPGFSPENQAFTASLARIMLLSPVLFGISALLSSLLQYFNRFLAYALAPILYNVGIILGILFLVPRFGLPGLAFGVVGGALLHMSIQVAPAFSSGFRFSSFSFSESKGIMKVFALALPRTFGAGAAYLNPVVMTALASTLTAGSIAVFSFANNLQAIPVGVIGISFSLAVFPHLSRAFSGERIEEFRTAFSSALRQIVFLALPFSALLFLLRSQIVRLVLGSGKFGWEDTRLTSAALGIFAVGILFQALIPFFMRTFFSLHNTKIPALSSALALLINASFAFLFLHALQNVNWFGSFLRSSLRIEDIAPGAIIALPLALALGGILQCVFLALALQNRSIVFSKEIWTAFLKIVLSSFALGIGTYLALRIFGTVFPLKTFAEVFWQTVFAVITGGLAFFTVARMLHCKELGEFAHSFKKQFYGE